MKGVVAGVLLLLCIGQGMPEERGQHKDDDGELLCFGPVKKVELWVSGFILKDIRGPFSGFVDLTVLNGKGIPLHYPMTSLHPTKFHVELTYAPNHDPPKREFDVLVFPKIERPAVPVVIVQPRTRGVQFFGPWIIASGLWPAISDESVSVITPGTTIALQSALNLKRAFLLREKTPDSRPSLKLCWKDKEASLDKPEEVLEVNPVTDSVDRPQCDEIDPAVAAQLEWVMHMAALAGFPPLEPWCSPSP